MPKKKLDKLKADANRAERISHTLNTNGWKDILDIIQAKYNDCLNDLLDKENPEARGGINAITAIMDAVSADIKFGEMARKKYNDIYLNIKRPDGE